MKPTKTIILFIFFTLLGCTQDRYSVHYQSVDSKDVTIYPEVISEIPDIPSPALNESGKEVVLVKVGDSHFTWFDATVENGDSFDYKKGLHGKGNQLLVDKEDFPTLAKSGLHSDKELANTKTITGRSVSQITIDGRPWGSSGVGFLAADETILSVIWGDNKIVRKMGLTHPDLARPLFHLWNVSFEIGRANETLSEAERRGIKGLIYNELDIQIKIEGSRGWQESIFNDEILGTGHIEIWRGLSDSELDFLGNNYKQLTQEQFEELKNKISHLHTGEMVLFYINRYGFYEGHNEYRPDPVSIAFIFGLRSVEELHEAADKDLYKYFTTHFTENPE